jgi:hyperosmotically inducible protein
MSGRSANWLAALAIAIASIGCAQTDAGITTAVKSKLAADDDVKAYQIDVTTNDKVVSLTGTVETTTAKTRAVEIARQQDGVASVVDNITVNSPTAQTPNMPSPDVDRATFTDPVITTAVKTAFAADGLVKARRLDVDTLDGIVTISGEVRSGEERDQAVKIARSTAGVKSVNDKMTVAR